MLPGQIGDTRVVATPLEGGTCSSRGRTCTYSIWGIATPTTPASCTCRRSGSWSGATVVYNGVHQYLAESVSDDALGAWLAAVDRVADLEARNLIAGHKKR